MPKHSDGPPLGGIRFGGLEALRASLPSKAINPHGIVTEENTRARQALADFAAYPERTKSIGKPLPSTQGISRRRAAALKQVEELRQQPRYANAVVVSDDDAIKLWLHTVNNDSGKYWYFIEEDKATGTKRRSRKYWSRLGAKAARDAHRIAWVMYV